MKEIKIAVIGCGAIALEAHLENIFQIPRVRLIALVDPDEKALAKAGGLFNVESKNRYTDVDKFLSESDADAVVVCTPAATHKEVCCKCMAAKRHVFVEKPIATNTADSQAMIDAAKSNNVKLMVGHYLRYMPHHNKARDLIKSGGIGKVFSAMAFEETLGIKPDEGIIKDLAPHYIDLLCYYFEDSKVERVFATAGKSNASSGDRETESEIKMFFNNGVIANINIYWVPGYGNWDACDRYIRFVGTKGFIKTGLTSSTLKIYRANNLINRMRGAFEFVPRFVLHPDMPIKGTSFRKELEDFVKAIDSNTEPPITGDIALTTVRIAEAALKSAESGEIVSVL